MVRHPTLRDAGPPQTLSYEPLRVFGPLGSVLGLRNAGKLIYDIDGAFQVATSTLVLLGVMISVVFLGVGADLLVQLNRRRYDLIPARSFESETA